MRFPRTVESSRGDAAGAAAAARRRRRRRSANIRVVGHIQRQVTCYIVNKSRNSFLFYFPMAEPIKKVVFYPTVSSVEFLEKTRARIRSPPKKMNVNILKYGRKP